MTNRERSLLDALSEILGIARKKIETRPGCPRVPAGIDSGLIPLMVNARNLLDIRKEVRAENPSFYDLIVLRTLEIGAETNPAMLEARLADLSALAAVWKSSIAESRRVSELCDDVIRKRKEGCPDSPKEG